MTDFTYKVFSADQTQMQTEAFLANGKPVSAMQDVLKVQLIPEDSSESSTITLIVTDDIDEAAALFSVGDSVVASFSAKGE